MGVKLFFANVSTMPRAVLSLNAKSMSYQESTIICYSICLEST